MKTLVTGGTGFIGSNLVKRLLEKGREVVVASDFSRVGTENLLDLGLRMPDIEIRKVDLRDYAQTLKATEGAEVVFHLAARVGGLEYLHGTEMAELSALQTNLIIDTNVFKACLEKGVEKLIYASSCAVYPMGEQYSPNAVFSESDLDLKLIAQPTQRIAGTDDNRLLTIDPDGGYGWAKLLSEVQLSWMKGIDIGIARIFNIYGESEPLRERAHVVADLIQKAIIYPKVAFRVWGNGKQTRDFLHVSDCVDALARLEAKASCPPIIVNISSGKPVPVSKLAGKIAKVSGKDIKIEYDPSEPVGPLSRTADTTKARELLGWEPKITLEEGVRRTYAWAQKRRKNVS